MKKVLICAVVCATALTSCIKDEALNAECDILGIDSVWLNANSGIIIGTPIVTNDHISVNIQKGADRSALNPTFTLTPGATITMNQDGIEVEANGVARDFSSAQTYTTHSEDGVRKKDYTVAFNYPMPISTCSFEHFQLDATGRYYNWYEVDTTDVDSPVRNYWASGNAGFALTGMGSAPADYPTCTDLAGVSGNGVKLVTRSTGSFGSLVGMPIAAGNIFLGEFRTAQAMLLPLKATRFGLQLVGGEPLYLEGYYKYTAGETYTDGDQNVLPEMHDTADIYAVLYEVDPENFEPLTGDSVFTSSRIVSLARIADPGEPTSWTHFREPFVYQNGKTFDEQRLRTDGYAITIVATSSRQGAYFEGAVGSTLYVDEIRIVWDGDIIDE